MVSQFLQLPEEFDASLHTLYERDSKPTAAAVNITDITAAHFSPGGQFDPHTTLVRSDGSATNLYFRPDSDDDGSSPEARKHHYALIETIQSATKQNLIETGEYQSFGGKGISNLNPVQALGYLNFGNHLSVSAKGLAGTHKVENEDIHETLMMKIIDAIPDPQTLRYATRELDIKLVIKQSAIQAAWQNYGSVFVKLDGANEPAVLYFEKDEPKIADRLLDEIVAASSGALRGARLRDDIPTPMAFYARPDAIKDITSDNNSVGISFTKAAGDTTQDYRKPHFFVVKNAQQAAKNLMLALS